MFVLSRLRYVATFVRIGVPCKACRMQICGMQRFDSCIGSVVTK